MYALVPFSSSYLQDTLTDGDFPRLKPEILSLETIVASPQEVSRYVYSFFLILASESLFRVAYKTAELLVSTFFRI